MKVSKVSVDEFLSQNKIQEGIISIDRQDLVSMFPSCEDISLLECGYSDELIWDEFVDKTCRELKEEIKKLGCLGSVVISLVFNDEFKIEQLNKLKSIFAEIEVDVIWGLRSPSENEGRGKISVLLVEKMSKEFQKSKFDLPILLGNTNSNELFICDLRNMPHLLIAGGNVQGNTAVLNAIRSSLLYKKHSSGLKFILVGAFSGLSNAKDAIFVEKSNVIDSLNSLRKEMDSRYELLKLAKVRMIKEYNSKFNNGKLNIEKGHKYMPYTVLIINEFADFMVSSGKEFETSIARIAQLGRAVGIHVIMATERLSKQVITNLIKANFPARVALKVVSETDSKLILDESGAEQLRGPGDMLVSIGCDVARVQCVLTSQEA